MPMSAGPMTAPAMALAACDEATTQNRPETKANPDATTVNTLATTTQTRLRVVASMSAPAGDSGDKPGDTADGGDGSDRAGGPATALQQHPQKRADASLHVGHEKVHGL